MKKNNPDVGNESLNSTERVSPKTRNVVDALLYFLFTAVCGVCAVGLAAVGRFDLLKLLAALALSLIALALLVNGIKLIRRRN